MKKKQTEHYVDNAAFLKSLKDWRDGCQKAKVKKKEAPPIPEYVGECFLKIATHLSFKPNFVNYTFRDDMISDGVENCLVYIHNFDPNKSSNPFGYFTQIIYYAFIRRIQKEKKHTYIKYKLYEQQVINGGASTAGLDGSTAPADSTMLNFDNVKDFIHRFDQSATERRDRRRAKVDADKLL
jgi:hypothetical protein